MAQEVLAGSSHPPKEPLRARGRSWHRSQQEDGLGSASLLQAWDGGRQVSAGLGGFLKAEAGLEDGTVWPGWGAGGTGGRNLEELSGASGGQAHGWRGSRARSCGFVSFLLQLWLAQQTTALPGTGAGRGPSRPERHTWDPGRVRERGSSSGFLPFCSSLFKKGKHSILEGVSVWGSKLGPSALGPQPPGPQFPHLNNEQVGPLDCSGLLRHTFLSGFQFAPL